MISFINLNEKKVNKLVFDHSGDYVVFFQNLSGEYNFEIKEKNINLNIYGVYVGEDKASFKLHTKQIHLAPNSKSNLLIKGVFKDKSKFIYEGLIRIEKKAQRSYAYQKNQNLVFSKDVFIDSRPFLEILANDVFCTHGSTTGRVNKNQLFYLMTRGLTEKRGERLLINGFLSEIYNKVNQIAPNLNLAKNINYD